jgi:hypothetical protein
MITLNLVYDNWIEGEIKPIANCCNIYGPNTFWDPYDLIKHYLDKGLAYQFLEQVVEEHEKFQVKRCKMSEIQERPDEKFYYVINHYSIELHRLFQTETPHGETNQALIDKKRPLSDEVIRLLKENDKFFVMFMTEHECDTEKGFKLMVEYIQSIGVDLKKLYIVNNNAKLDWLKKIYGDHQVNEHGLEFIPSSSTMVLNRLGSNYKKEKEGKFFLCHNKSPKTHRYAVLCLLKKYGILDDVNWSLIPSWYGYPIDDFYFPLFDRYMIEVLDDEIQYFNNIKMKTSDYEGDEGWFHPFSDIDKSMLPHWQQIPEKHKTYEESYVNIVTESLYTNSPNVVQITEKSFRPFFYYQLPIIFASPHHISIMKSRYGLDFFEDIIDHNYDDKLDDKQRFFETMREVKRLYENKDKIIEFYHNNYDRLESNKQKVLDILKIKRDYIFFSNLGR